MSKWYENFSEWDLSKVASKSTGMDDFLSGASYDDEDIFSQRSASEDGPAETPSRIRVASTSQLKGFTRIANTDTLIRHAEKDLWAIKEGDDGEFLIERLFDDDGNPLTV